MAGIISQIETQWYPLVGHYICHIPVMVFDISGTEGFFRIVTAFKFTKNFLVRLVQNIGLNIQPSPMGHA